MSKAKGIAIRTILAAAFVIAISFFFGASFYLSLIIVAGLGVFGEIIHMPENMPGAIDNPDGKELHPAKAICIGLVVVLVLIGFGILFPELYGYGFGTNS
ncbi:hypothetical protein [Microbulbifer sp. PSTR4-B]|uniref:hypothetical protein n=1 Tax=Microbulbifer sp. PSTR4-B TaxID=3243396 RepID=UPI0040390126